MANVSSGTSPKCTQRIDFDDTNFAASAGVSAGVIDVLFEDSTNPAEVIAGLERCKLMVIQYFDGLS